MKRVLVLGAILLSACGSTVATKAPVTPSASATPTPSPIAAASTSTLPLGRWAASMAYDEARHDVVLFGGLSGGAPLGDTWSWDGTRWTPHQGLTVTPPPRQGAAMAYDELDRQVLLFGGVGSNGPLNDSWAWDGAAWQQLHPSHSPSKREGGDAVYDPGLKAIILFGGMDDSTATASAINDTWSWSRGDWTQLQAQGPAGGVRPRLAWLGGANLIERFGDCRGSHDAAIYSFDGQNWTPKPTTGQAPPALCLPSLGGDLAHNAVVLFGGNPGTGVSPVPADTWIYDGNAWTKASPAQSPPARDDARLIYDSDHRVLVLFGGQGLNQGQSGPLNDTWTWDGSIWTLHQ